MVYLFGVGSSPFLVQFAYKVRFPVVPTAISVILFLNSLSVYQPAKVYPSRVGAAKVIAFVPSYSAGFSFAFVPSFK